jgi:hypothetical protein
MCSEIINDSFGKFSNADDFYKLTLELIKNGRKYRSAYIKNDSDSESQLSAVKEFVSVINKCAKKYSFIGGAFGVANLKDNKFELIKQPPGFSTAESKHELTLFPYPENASLADELFECVRETQRVSSSDKIRLPEFYTKLVGTHDSSGKNNSASCVGGLWVPWTDIQKIVENYKNLGFGPEDEKWKNENPLDSHKNSIFPVIPYVYLHRHVGEHIHHVIIPVLHTVTEQVEVDQNLKSSATVVFLGTYQGENELNENNLLEFFHLLRLAAEPIIDVCFYANVVAAKSVETATQREHARAHKILMLLQRPLDSLTDAFDKVQAEAQEMQAILNDPEEGIFKAHKALAPLFHEGHTIQVSNFIPLTPRHNWDASIGLQDLQTAYCYALACIFGIQNRLEDAQTHSALIEKTYTALKEKRESVVNTELISLLGVICGFNALGDPELECSVRIGWTKGSGGTRIAESNLDAQERFSKALKMLKRVAFTPFKSFGHEWPTAPVQIASITNQIMKGEQNLDSELSPSLKQEDTPFSQQAILTFLVGMKSEISAYLKQTYRNENPITSCKVEISGRDVSKDNGGILTEYRFELPCHFFGRKSPKNDINGKDLQADLNALQNCLRSTIRHGIVGKVMGSFHGIFQDLLRHGLNLATPVDYSKDSWVLLEPPQPSWNQSILLVLGKAIKDRPSDSTNGLRQFCDSEDKCGRYFAIVQEQNSKKDQETSFFLRIVWTDKKSQILELISSKSEQDHINGSDNNPSKNIINGQEQSLTSESSDEDTQPPDGGASQYANIICIDHNGAWYDALKKIKFLKDNLSQYEFSKINEFNPDSKKPCVVILHGNPPDSENSAVAWKDKLKKLHGEKRILRVIVASAGGHPREKGIAKDECFVFAVDENSDQGIQVQDIQDPNSSKRSSFFKLLLESYKNE